MMTKEQQKFYICKHCGNIVEFIENTGVPLVCCGEKMNELVANTTDASVEKHVPVFKVDGNIITIYIGSNPHPMIPAHYITWVYIQTDSGIQRKALAPDNEPTVKFSLIDDDKLRSVFAYCNLHGLWKAEIQ
jgi:superoxide reductase